MSHKKREEGGKGAILPASYQDLPLYPRLYLFPLIFATHLGSTTQSRKFPMANASETCAHPWMKCGAEPALKLSPKQELAVALGVAISVYSVCFLAIVVLSYPYFSTCWASFASCFRRRGHGSVPEECPTGMPCQPPQPAAQMRVFPDSVPMEDILPVYNDFGAPPHYLGHEWDTDESLGHPSSHKDLRAPPPSYQGL